MGKLFWICMIVATAAIVQDQRRRNIERVTPGESAGAVKRASERTGGWIRGRGEPSSGGFSEVGVGKDVPRDTVLVIGALNCGSDGSRRADALAEALRERGIPVARRSRFGLDVRSLDAVQLAAASRRMQRVFDGPTPVVIINTRGSANPSLDQVLAEYRAQTVR